MKTTNKALINYYARLINKGTYKIEDVPDDLKSQVKKAAESLNDEESDS